MTADTLDGRRQVHGGRGAPAGHHQRRRVRTIWEAKHWWPIWRNFPRRVGRQGHKSIISEAIETGETGVAEQTTVVGGEALRAALRNAGALGVRRLPGGFDVRPRRS